VPTLKRRLSVLLRFGRRFSLFTRGFRHKVCKVDTVQP
jgi:hypothetical protein